jgi:hypothetical protein
VQGTNCRGDGASFLCMSAPMPNPLITKLVIAGYRSLRDVRLRSARSTS